MQPLAMKVQNKKTLMKKKQLKYAVSEANIMKQFDNPFIVKLLYAFQTPTNLYLVLEHCSGGDLEHHLDEREVFDVELAKFFAAEILLALEYLHSKKILYRDLKPGNILVDADGHIKLADFGLAKDNMGSRCCTYTFCGSPAYLPPEMFGKEGITFQSDVYQLGTILYEMLVGLPPFFTSDFNELYKNIQQDELKVPDIICEEGKDLLHKMLDKDPQKRIKIKEIKKHAFFHDIDWDALSQR